MFLNVLLSFKPFSGVIQSRASKRLSGQQEQWQGSSVEGQVEFIVGGGIHSQVNMW